MKRGNDIIFFLLVLMILGFAAMIYHAKAADPERVKCATVGGDVRLGQDPTTVPLKCCPRDFYLADPGRPTDKRGNLVCVRET